MSRLSIASIVASPVDIRSLRFNRKKINSFVRPSAWSPVRPYYSSSAPPSVRTPHSSVRLIVHHSVRLNGSPSDPPLHRPSISLSGPFYYKSYGRIACPSVRPAILASVNPSIFSSARPSTRPATPSVGRLGHLSVRPRVSPSVSLAHPYVRPPVHPHARAFVHLSVPSTDRFSVRRSLRPFAHSLVRSDFYTRCIRANAYISNGNNRVLSARAYDCQHL